MCRRAVRVKSQLKSHKRFANAFLTYCQYVDNARLYCTNALEGPPKVTLFLITKSINFSSACKIFQYIKKTGCKFGFFFFYKYQFAPN